MSYPLYSDKVYVGNSKIPNAGLGVFARVPIKKGEVIEKCPIIELPPHDEETINNTFLINYLFYLGNKKDRLTLALGYGSIYNHANTPNAKYKGNSNEKLLEIIAIKDIKKDEEITINYSPEDKSGKLPMWFED